jgi:hypothetical protein
MDVNQLLPNFAADAGTAPIYLYIYLSKGIVAPRYFKHGKGIFSDSEGFAHPGRARRGPVIDVD